MALGDKMILRTADIVDRTGLSMRYWQRRLASAAMVKSLLFRFR